VIAINIRMVTTPQIYVYQNAQHW